MRVVTLVFMIIAFLVGGICTGILFKNIENRMGTDGDASKTEELYRLVETAKKDIEQLKKEGIDVTKIEDPQIQEKLELIESVPPKWQAIYPGKLGMLVAALSFVMVIVAFMKKEFITKLSILVAILSILLWVITPNIEETVFSGANPKILALIGCIALVVSSTCAFFSYKLHVKKIQAIA